MVRRIFVVLALAALAVVGVLLVRPVRTSVSTSVLPDALRNAASIRLGGTSGLTLDIDGPTATVDCGPPLAPYTITVEDPNVLSKLAGAAERVESRIRRACSEAIDARRLQAAGAGGGALVLFALAVAARRTPATVYVAPPAGWPGAFGPPAGGLENRVAPGQPLPPPGMSTALPPSPPRNPPTVPEPGTPTGDGGRRRPVVVAAVGGLVVASAVGWWGLSRSGADEGPTSGGRTSVGSPQTTEDPRRAVERSCMTTALTTSDGWFDEARAQSIADQKRSKLNLDGDSSFSDFATRLDRVGLATCPTDFRAGFMQYASAWREYGDRLKGATKGPFPDRFSDADRRELTNRINRARGLIDDIAEAAGCTVVRPTFSAG